MTIYSVRDEGLPSASAAVRRARAMLLAALLLPGLAACEVEWGGASVHLEDPSPPPEPPPDTDPVAEQVEVPLPEGPLLWAVRAAPPGGEVLALPIARLVEGAPADLGYPELPSAEFRARFDSAFAGAGTELHMGAAGVRLGSLALRGPPRVLDAGCPSAVPATPLVPPGTSLPPLSFALGPGVVVESVSAPSEALIDNRMRTFGPILAEQLLRQGGEDRPYLARRADLAAVPWPGDERPAMAATYLINDSLGGPAPAGAAVSLFFLARFGARGYAADWSEMRSYGGGEGSREILTWVGAAPLPDGRLDFASLHDGAARRLVASRDSEDPDRGIAWTEGERCRSLDLLEVPGAVRAEAEPEE